MNLFSKFAQNLKSRRVSRGLQSLVIAGLMLATASPAPVRAEHASANIFAQVATRIPCVDSPFGRTAMLGVEAEFMELIARPGTIYSDMTELQFPQDNADAFLRSFTNYLEPGEMTFLDATALDLNGDGSEEFVAAYREGSTGWLRLRVIRRHVWPDGDIAALSFDNWILEMSFNEVHLAAGDLDGSADNKEELAVLVERDYSSTNRLQVYVLEGNSDGNLARADNEWDARYILYDWAGAQSPSLAIGDMLLDGHEQIVVNAYVDSGATRYLLHMLAEYEPTSSVFNTQDNGTIGATTNWIPFNDFRLDDATSKAMEFIYHIDTLAGNVVGDARAELVNVVQFNATSFSYIGLRLQHYVVTRDNGYITDIDLARRDANDPGSALDWGVLVQQGLPAGAASFDATISDVNRLSPSEIVIARAVPGSSDLQVEAWKAAVDFEAGFTFEVNDQQATFINTSTGGGTDVVYEWDFGDGHELVTENAAQPVHHDYSETENVTVKLTATAALGDGDSREVEYLVNTGSDIGGDLVPTVFRLHDNPTWLGQKQMFQQPSFVRIAVMDMNKDGVDEIATLAKPQSNELLRSRWWLSDPTNELITTFASRHASETSSDFVSIERLDIVPVDFDGDSVRATLGTDCRLVHEPQLRKVVWLPPYFERLQADSAKEASFGRSTESGSTAENQSGSYTSHSISSYVGAGVGIEEIGGNVELRATAGYQYQASEGVIRGSGNSFEVTEGFMQDEGEALVVYETNDFNCYSYHVGSDEHGIDPLSGVRMCEVIDDTHHILPSDAVTWSTIIPAATPEHPPAAWVPLQRDWNSIALFEPVTSNVSFYADEGADKATDGLFTTEAKQQGVSLQPYLQVDLGKVRDISSIRIFPATEGYAEAMLAGFHIYTSKYPMNGSGLPSGSNVQVYEPLTEDDSVYDRWNVWTRDSANPGQLLKARYIRLQHPGPEQAQLRIAEIQVYGDLHVDPPDYPDTVCDPDRDDGLAGPEDDWFYVWVWNEDAEQYEKIQQRGRLLWDGTYENSFDQMNPPDGSSCENWGENDDLDYAQFDTHASIWGNGLLLGSSGGSSWRLGQTTTNMVGETKSFDSAINVGASFDAEGGFIATVSTGASYETATGATSSVQTTSYWTEGLELGGFMDGFEDSDVALLDECGYNARPYGYHLVERSVVGYRHDIYMVDYIVRASQSNWHRGSVPSICRGDAIFADGFD